MTKTGEPPRTERNAPSASSAPADAPRWCKSGSRVVRFAAALAIAARLAIIAHAPYVLHAIAAAAEPVKPLPTIDEKDLAQVLERHKGKVVLLDFWALWCTTCIEEMPHTAAMQKELRDRGLVVVTVSIDDAGDAQAAAELLAAKAPGFTENYRSKFGGSDDSVTRFAIPAGVPHLRLYDRAGKLRQSFPGESDKLDGKQIRAAVERLLAE